MTKPVVIITGASRGIGAATAKAFARDGYDVVINYNRSLEAAEAVKTECESLGATAMLYCADVSDYGEAKDMIDTVVETFGAENIYALVNNAGITRDGLFLRMSKEQFDAVVGANLGSCFNLCSLVAPILLKNRKGRIINLSSAAGIHGNAGQANYAASKAAIIGFTKSIARELASRSITVNAVAPGFIETDMTKTLPDKIVEKAKDTISLCRFGRPEEIASVILFLASESASYITGQVISADGGII